MIVSRVARWIVIATLWMLASINPSAAQTSGRFPDALDFRTSGWAAGRLHFNRSTPAAAGSSQRIASTAASILSFQATTWGFPSPVFWDVYVTDRRLDNGSNLGSTSVSATRKVAGATKPGPLACVTLLSLDNITAAVGSPAFPGANFNTLLDYVMAHEATHCYQRITSSAQKETVAYSLADWFMEGSASWLAGDFLESTGSPYPGFFESFLQKHHQESFLTFAQPSAVHFFFKWLEGSQGLRQRAKVVTFVHDMSNVPLASCATDIPVEVFPDERQAVSIKDCSAVTSPYDPALKQYFGKQGFAHVLAQFGSALVRGTVPGIASPQSFIKTATLLIVPGYATARADAMAAGALLPAPLGKIAVLTNSGGKQSLPEPFGFVVFRIQLSRMLIPPPSGFDLSMEGVSPEIQALLSTNTSEDVLDQTKGWIRARSLRDNWVTVARSDPGAGADAHILVRAVP